MRLKRKRKKEKKIYKKTKMYAQWQHLTKTSCTKQNKKQLNTGLHEMPPNFIMILKCNFSGVNFLHHHLKHGSHVGSCSSDLVSGHKRC